MITAYSEFVLNFLLTSLGWTCSLSAERHAWRWDALVASSLHRCTHTGTQKLVTLRILKLVVSHISWDWAHSKIIKLFLQVCDPVEFAHEVLWAREYWSLSQRLQYQHTVLHDRSGSLTEKQEQPNFSCIVCDKFHDEVWQRKMKGFIFSFE